MPFELGKRTLTNFRTVKTTYLSVDRLDLLEGGEDEDGSLSHAGLGLAENVHAQDGLGDALVLNWKRRNCGRVTIHI